LRKSVKNYNTEENFSNFTNGTSRHCACVKPENPPLLAVNDLPLSVIANLLVQTMAVGNTPFVQRMIKDVS
jgi:hypothetical protein